MSRLGALARKDLRDILREKTIVVALVVQLFIAGFSTFLAVGLTGLYDPSSTSARAFATVAYVGPGGFDELLAQAPNLQVVHRDAQRAVDDFHANRVTGVVREEIGDGGVRKVSLLLEDGGIPSTLLLTQAKGLLERYEEQLRLAHQPQLQQQVLTVEAPARPTLPYAFVYATLLPLLVFTPVFLSGAVAGDSVAQEVQTRTFVLLRSGPLGVPRILLGKLVVPVLLAPAQLLLWVGLLALNHLSVANLLWLLLLSAETTLLLAGIGVALAAGLGKSNAVQAAYALVAILLALVSLLLPANPLNLAALLATGAADARVWSTLVILGGLAIVTTLAGLAWAARRLRIERA